MPKSSVETVFTISELASYLHLGENTVLKLARSKKIPGSQQDDSHWIFQKEEIDTWLAEQITDEDPDLENPIDGMYVPLGDLLTQDGVIDDLRSTTAVSVIEELAARAYSNGWLKDKPWFVGALMEREALASTAMEGGVAFLHTRMRDHKKIARPFIVVGRSYKGIDFGAADGKKTYLFFLLGLQYDKLHLPILGRLARVLRNPQTVAKLRSYPSGLKLRSQLLQEDMSALAVHRAAPMKFGEKELTLDRTIRLRKIMQLSSAKLKD